MPPTSPPPHTQLTPHPIAAAPLDIANVSVVGLKGLPYVDNTTSALHTDEAAAVTFPGGACKALGGVARGQAEGVGAG